MQYILIFNLINCIYSSCTFVAHVPKSVGAGTVSSREAQHVLLHVAGPRDLRGRCAMSVPRASAARRAGRHWVPLAALQPPLEVLLALHSPAARLAAQRAPATACAALSQRPSHSAVAIPNRKPWPSTWPALAQSQRPRRPAAQRWTRPRRTHCHLRCTRCTLTNGSTRRGSRPKLCVPVPLSQSRANRSRRADSARSCHPKYQKRGPRTQGPFWSPTGSLSLRKNSNPIMSYWKRLVDKYAHSSLF